MPSMIARVDRRHYDEWRPGRRIGPSADRLRVPSGAEREISEPHENPNILVSWNAFRQGLVIKDSSSHDRQSLARLAADPHPVALDPFASALVGLRRGVVDG